MGPEFSSAPVSHYVPPPPPYSIPIRTKQPIMVSEDRQRIIETNRSLRLIKNELETLLEKGIIDDTAFDSITSLLPAESPLSGGASAASRKNTPIITPIANLPTPAPSTTASSPIINPSAPPSYAQSTASPPALPTRNNPAPPPAAPEKPVLAHARALYRYAATDARDVSLERDDRVAVHEYMNADWWMGKNVRTGEEGIFPKSYVVVEESEKKNAYQQPQQQAQHYPVSPVPVSGYPAPPPAGPAHNPGAYGHGHQQQQGDHGEPSKVEQNSKKFGKIVNSIF